MSKTSSVADKPKCSDCGKPLRHVLYDWLQHLPFCGDCWLTYLTDYRAAHPE
jgi:hypothetical protein